MREMDGMDGMDDVDRVDGVDVMVVVGLALLGAGLAGWDWRLALVVLGSILLVLGVWQAGMPPPPDGDEA